MKSIPLLVGLFAVTSALADEETIRRVLSAKLTDGKIVAVQKLPRGGLFEITVQREGGHAILYTDESAQLIFIGKVIDTASDRDLTEERLRKLSTVDWNSLPWQRAITMKRGDGRRQIAIFSDPNCPYC